RLPLGDAGQPGPCAQQPQPQRRDVRQDQSHQRKVTRVSRPSTCGMLDGSSNSISTCTTRASVDEAPSGSTRCMRFTVGATRAIVPLNAAERPGKVISPLPPG